MKVEIKNQNWQGINVHIKVEIHVWIHAVFFYSFIFPFFPAKQDPCAVCSGSYDPVLDIVERPWFHDLRCQSRVRARSPYRVLHREPQRHQHLHHQRLHPESWDPGNSEWINRICLLRRLTSLHISVADLEGAQDPPPPKMGSTIFPPIFIRRLKNKAQIARESINPESFQGPYAGPGPRQ